MKAASLVAAALAAAAHGSDLAILNPAGERFEVSIAQLDEAVGAETRRIRSDFMYEADKTFIGYDLAAVMRRFGLPLEEDYLFVCEDGYEASVPAQLLQDAELQGFLARGDAQAPTNAAWAPLPASQAAAELSPLYLAWRSEKLSAAELRALPWPYGLREIRPVNLANRLAGLTPDAAASAVVQRGHALYRRECVKCHRLAGVGAQLGPDLSYGATVKFLNHDALVEVVANIGRYYPGSKMPDYADSLAPAELDALVHYLRHMAGPNEPPGSR